MYLWADGKQRRANYARLPACQQFSKGNSLQSTLPYGILILGLPGAGKSTLAASLAETTGMKHLMASVVLRDYANRSPELAEVLNGFWARGANAPDEIVEPVLWDAYSSAGGDAVILDGYPRTLSQLTSFSAKGGNIALVLQLNVSPDVAETRINARRGARAIETSPVFVHQRIDAELETVHSLLAAFPCDRCVSIDANTLTADEVLRQATERAEKVLYGA